MSEREGESDKLARRVRSCPMSLALAIGFGALIAVAVGATLWISLSAAKDNALRMLSSAGETLVNGMIENVEDHLYGAENQVAFLVELIAERELDPGNEDKFADVLLGILGAAPEILGIGFIREDSRIFGLGRGREGIVRIRASWEGDPRTRYWLDWARASQSAAWLGVTWSKILERPGIVYVNPVRRGGEFLGVMIGLVSLESLSEFIADTSGDTQLATFILTGSRQVIAHANSPERVLQGGPDRPLPTIQSIGDPSLALFTLPAEYNLREARPDAEVEGKLVRDGDLAVVFFYRDVFGFAPDAWTFGIHAPLAEVERAFGSLPVALLIGLSILGVAILLAILLSRMIALPLSRFAAVSGAVRQLEISRAQPLGPTYLREINRAADAYNAMLNALRWFEIYLPKQLVTRLMRQGASAVPSEEREVTVLFTDIVGFTTIASQLTPAELADLLNEHFGLLAEAIESEGGTIDKYIGDSVMAFWGAPDDQPDHAERAARAMIAAERALDSANRRRASEGLLPLCIRAGLHSGPAIVGNIGAPGRVNYTLIGDTVNAAQRIEALGKGHMKDHETAIVLVSGEVAERLDAGFELVPLEELVLRGRSQPTKIFRLAGRRDSVAASQPS